MFVKMSYLGKCSMSIFTTLDVAQLEILLNSIEDIRLVSPLLENLILISPQVVTF